MHRLSYFGRTLFCSETSDRLFILGDNNHNAKTENQANVLGTETGVLVLTVWFDCHFGHLITQLLFDFIRIKHRESSRLGTRAPGRVNK